MGNDSSKNKDLSNKKDAASISSYIPQTYTITIWTGDFHNAGTRAAVTAQIWGKNGTSGLLALKESQNNGANIFQRGHEDNIQVKVKMSLGPLTKVRLSHDNSGSHPNWFVRRVAIKDDESNEVYHFVFNEWIKRHAVERDVSPFLDHKDNFHVIVLEARALNSNVISDKPKQNLYWIGLHHEPYTTIQYGVQNFTTPKAHKTTNPVWEKALSTFAKDNSSSIMTVKVFDFNSIQSDTYIGEVAIDLSKYQPGEIIDEWFELEDKTVEELKEGKKELTSSDDEKKEQILTKLSRSKTFQLSDIVEALRGMGLNQHDIIDILFVIKRRLQKPRIHLRIYYCTPEYPHAIKGKFVFYHEHVNKIKTGDIIAYAGNGSLSRKVQAKTNSPYNHIGIIVRINPSEFSTVKKKGYVPPDHDVILCIEATSNHQKQLDYFDDQVRIGVNAFDLEEQVQLCSARGMWHIPLVEPLTADQEKKLVDWLRDTYEKRIPYDSLSMFLVGIPGWTNKEDLSALFCSELVAAALKQIGLFEGNASAMTPVDVVEHSCYDSTCPNMIEYMHEFTSKQKQEIL